MSSPEAAIGAAVLRSTAQIHAARRSLDARGLSALSPAVLRFLARRRWWRRPVTGDWLKSWDVELTLSRVIAECAPGDLIVDMGAYGCEIIPALSRAGFRNLLGVDLEPRLERIPAGPGVRWQVGDFLDPAAATGQAAAVTSISVIEHGFDGAKLAKAVSAWLRPGGLFLASFDYWPEKIDTSAIRLFNLSWTIFSRAEIAAFLTEAARHGLHPAGPVDLEAADRVIRWGGQAYTFGWLALRKTG